MSSSKCSITGLELFVQPHLSALSQLQRVRVLVHTGTHSSNTGKNMHSHSHPLGAKPWQNQASL